MHCSTQCKPVLVREHPALHKYHQATRLDQLHGGLYHRAGVVFKHQLHPQQQHKVDLQVEAVQLYITHHQKNGQWVLHNLGDMADKKKRDQLVAEWSRGGGEKITLEVRFTTREKKG